MTCGQQNNNQQKFKILCKSHETMKDTNNNFQFEKGKV